MNYNSVLDTFFSYSFWYINLGVLFIFILIASYFRKKFLKKNSNKLWFDIPFGGMIVLWVLTFYLLNPVFLGYSHPRGVDGIVSKNGKNLCGGLFAGYRWKICYSQCWQMFKDTYSGCEVRKMD